MPSKNPVQRTAAQRKWYAKARLRKLNSETAGMMITDRDHARWNRAIKRLMKDIKADVTVYTKDEIAKRWPDGYDTSKLKKSGEGKRRGRKPKIDYGF